MFVLSLLVVVLMLKSETRRNRSREIGWRPDHPKWSALCNSLTAVLGAPLRHYDVRTDEVPEMHWRYGPRLRAGLHSRRHSCRGLACRTAEEIVLDQYEGAVR